MRTILFKSVPCLKYFFSFFSKSSYLFLECDYLVVGSGSAGSVLAHRLSTQYSHDYHNKKINNKVILVEAGPYDNTWKVKMPAALMYLLKDPKYSWCYQTTEQRAAGGRVFYWPRGKLLGGCSSVNAMVYIRGHPMDYDRWRDEEGVENWGFRDCLPYFKKSQSHSEGGDEFRGTDGPLKVTRGTSSNPLYQCFMEAGKEAGYGLTDDVNGFRQEGFGSFDMTIHAGQRWSAAEGYLRNQPTNSNLSILTETFVTKVLFDKKKAVGVEIIRKGKKEKVKVKGEVILSSGAINSPQILMLSGLGDPDHLRELGIPLLSPLKGVGSNLQDHLEVYLQYKCLKPITLYPYQWSFPHRMISAGLQWFIKKNGVASSSHLEKGCFFRSSNLKNHPDIQVHFLPSVVLDHGQKMSKCHAYQAHTGTLRASSRGSLKLKSPDPFSPPIIDPNYFSTQEDIEDMRTCVRLTREIYEQKAFNEFNGGLLDKDLRLEKDQEIDLFVRSAAESAYHPSGTAKMGKETDEKAVVDWKCRVKGVDNLRVVDASIMPSIISGNLNAPVIMMAEKAADLILGNTPLPPSSPKIWTRKYPHLQREK